MKRTLALIALILTAAAPSEAKATAPIYRMYCSVETRVAYFATFDSGDSDGQACGTTATLWDMYLESKRIPDHKCWCTATISA